MHNTTDDPEATQSQIESNKEYYENRERRFSPVASCKERNSRQARRQSRTHLEDFGVGDGDDRNNVGGDDGGGGGDDDCGCDSDCGWQEAEVTLLPREGTEVHHLSKQTLHHTQVTYEMFLYKMYNDTPV